MLAVYTRHYPPCRRTDPHHRRCHCPKWIRGRLEGEGLIRRSAHTRNWSKAERLARELERHAEFPGVIAVKEAVVAYLADQRARKLSPPTLTPMRALFEKRFLPWCEDRQLVRLDAVRTPQLKEFRCTWECNARTARRRHERLRSFFAFCVSNGWLLANPTDGMKKPIAPRTVPTDYFNRREFDRILAATREYEYCGFDCHDRAERLRTLVMLMRWSGLAIKDAATLNRSRLDADGALFLRRAKTGAPVYVPLPPALVSALRQLPSSNPSYFFWSGVGQAHNAISGYQRSLRKLFRIAALCYSDGSSKPCRSHMFRDTFAVELLLAGVPIDQVSALLGHRSIKMTEKHYLPWVKARQKQLTASVRRAWFAEVRALPPAPNQEIAVTKLD
jgi:integrase/recombinase XerD